MKRLFIIASLAILAVGCQKTFVDNEVNNAIGFSTEVSKQTRAIAQGSGEGSYLAQPFGVYAWGHQTDDDENASVGENTDPVMNNVIITPQTVNSNTEWKSGDGFTYYWPNDPRTHINFYAYSPYSAQYDGAAPHQYLACTSVSHNETAGFALTGYKHKNMYVDFMVGRPVIEAKYGDQGGTSSDGDDAVPVEFNHQMTQIVFKVKTNGAYGSDTQATTDDITFTVNNITLNNIYDSANYSHSTLNADYSDDINEDQTVSFKHGAWTGHSITSGEGEPKGTFQIFPVKKYSGDAPNGAPSIDADEVAKKVTNETILETTPVTMIPQALHATTEALTAQSFTIEYEIKGKGVANEVVVKEIPFITTVTGASSYGWTENKRITYVVTIGLNEIKFAPTVAGWGDQADNDVYVDDEVTVEIVKPQDPSSGGGASN